MPVNEDLPATTPTDVEIRRLAERMARKLDVHVDRAERGVRNLIARGLISVNSNTKET